MLDTTNLDKIIKFSKTLTVLYVEDNIDTRESTVKMLSHFFKHVIVGVDGNDGLLKYKENKDVINLILTDINMPNLNGIEMLEMIREIDKEIRCIILSAHNEVEFFLDSIELGVDGYILKPIEIQQFTDILSKVIYYIKLETEKDRARKTIENFAKELSIKVKEEVEKNKEQEKQLIQQSKLASMGEMIDAVAHQWLQPLNIINGNSGDMRVKVKYLNETISSEQIINFTENISLQINHLTQTLQEFRSFFRPNIDKNLYNIKELIESTLVLLNDVILQHNIIFDIKSDDLTISTKLNESEFKHVIINLINNSKDAFEENNISNKQIICTISQDDKNTTISYQDNAGGIPENIINDIFKPNITTKPEDKGSGIGLYISRQIIEKINGTIEVKNVNDGANFTVTIPTEK